MGGGVGGVGSGGRGGDGGHQLIWLVTRGGGVGEGGVGREAPNNCSDLAGDEGGKGGRWGAPESRLST